jgi:hypothetical protein
MDQALNAKDEQLERVVSTILSDQVVIPINCEHCHRDTDVSLQQLKQQSPILCEHCYSVRTFSDTELKLTRMLLAQAGYHFAL